MEPDFTQLERETLKLIEAIEPNAKSNAVRSRVADFMRDIVQRHVSGAVLLECGSTCTRTYLPDSDLDLILFTEDGAEDDIQVLMRVFAALCEEIGNRDKQSNPMLSNSTHSNPPIGSNVNNNNSSSSSSSCQFNGLFTIRSVEFVNARTRLLSCVVNNIQVDVTLNQRAALGSLLFLDAADTFLGHDHLFKRSLLLVKLWCQQESGRYTGGASILGARRGMLSSYAVSAMVLHTFNLLPPVHPLHPLAVLLRFFSYFAHFPWQTHALTLGGA
ncbi:hypothetical protein EON64_09260, partial [archaeon]